MYGTPRSLNTMNGMGGEVIDGSGTIDPANLSNSGMFCHLPFRSVIRPLCAFVFGLASIATCLSRKPPTPPRAHDRFLAIRPKTRARKLPCPFSLHSITIFLSPAFKLIPPLVSGLPAPSPAEPSPRGTKRSRTPDHSGNGHTEGDQDDGTCLMGR